MASVPVASFLVVGSRSLRSKLKILGGVESAVINRQFLRNVCKPPVVLGDT